MRHINLISSTVLVAGLIGLAACSGITPTTAPSGSGKGFTTQQFCGGVPGPCGANPWATPWSVSPLGMHTAGFGGPGWGGPSWGVPGFGGAFGCNSNAVCPVGGDWYGGLTVVTDRGRIDRQPASLPLGVAEENDVAFRPLGSDIWQPK